MQECPLLLLLFVFFLFLKLLFIIIIENQILFSLAIYIVEF